MTIFDDAVTITADGRAVDASESLADHQRKRGGTAADLHARVDAAAMRGYGGALFPVSRKWQAALQAGGGGLVVANGAESEPASSKDAALLQLRPHLVLDGLNATIRATGSTAGVVWVHHDALHSRAAVDRALHERRAHGVGDSPIWVVEAPAHYLSGESSAVVRALSGDVALPRTSRVPAAHSGVGGKPTVVHNVETLARVACLGQGEHADGVRLLTVSSPAGRVVVEPRPDAHLTSLVAPVTAGDVQAVLLGGYGGIWRRWQDVASATVVDLEAEARAGIVMALPANDCGITLTSRIVSYLAASSARQCGPCLFGLSDIAEVMERVARGRARASDTARLQQLTALVSGRGACHHPDGALHMLTSALTVFSADLAAHRRGRRCNKRHTLDPTSWRSSHDRSTAHDRRVAV